jgi:GT2 family glycosyltransferase
MKVAVLILTWNAADAALQCLQSLAQQTRPPDKILVVDNASHDGTVEGIRRQFPEITLIRNSRNLGFAVGMNTGIRALQQLSDPPDIVALLNQDTILDPHWLGELVAPFEQGADIGAVGCKLRYPDGTIQHAGARLDWPRAIAHHIGAGEPDSGQYDEAQPYDIVTGAAIALRLAALDTVGLFDPGYTPAYYEDTDLCWRLRHHNYRILYAPKATLTHQESLSLRDETRRSSYYNRGRLRFILKSYAIADILGEFAHSERAFIAQHGHRREERALRWAYVETLLRLPDILHARNAFYPPTTAQETEELTRLLLDLKQAVTMSMYHRAQSTLDAFYTYE